VLAEALGSYGGRTDALTGRDQPQRGRAGPANPPSGSRPACRPVAGLRYPTTSRWPRSALRAGDCGTEPGVARSTWHNGMGAVLGWSDGFERVVLQ